MVLIVYSDETHLIGRRFPNNLGSGKAQGPEPFRCVSRDERHLDAIIDVFAPVRDRATGSVIAVVELHERVSALESRN